MRKAIKKLASTGFLHIFSSEVLNKIIVSCSGIIVVNFLSKELYGVYSYAMNILSTFLIFSGFGASSALIQLGSENLNDIEKKEKFAKFSYRFGMIVNFGMFFAILLFCQFFSFPIPEAKKVLLLLSCMPLVYFTVETIQIYFRIHLYNKWFSYLSTGIAFANSVMLILGALSNQLTVLVGLRYVGYFLVIFATVALTRPPFLFPDNSFSCGKEKRKEQEERGELLLTKAEKKDFFSIGFVALFNNSVSSLLYIIDGWLIGSIIADSTVLADYHTATLIPFAMTFVPSAIITYVYPYVASHHEDIPWLKKNVTKLYGIMAVVNGVISLGLYFFAPWIFAILFSGYTDAIPIFRVLSIGFFFSGTFRILSGNVLVMLHRLKVNSVVAVISGVLNVILDYFWIKQYGSIGAAYATTAIYIISGLLSTAYVAYYIYRRRCRTNEVE
ncbi:oligosaccharide flippase family protein [uncultured Murdochiella sp.]|uniref:oligosaccharide flippase family protein n=1 Tax=uncultured Murdochiella sp. TaxID=1586095 RepID=UPI0028064E68|nr:oligosaccharide flippase family protein [uncultured Murdochiella sp.]